MKPIKKAIWILFCSSALLACSLFTPRSVNLTNPSTGGITPGAPGSSTPTPLPDALKGYFLPDASIGLASLKSFHQELKVTFKGAGSSQAQDEEDSTIRDYQQQPFVDVSTHTGPDIDEQPGTIFKGTLGGAHYLRLSPSEPCTVYWEELQPTDAMQPNPASRLPAIKSATLAGSETVKGVEAKHYQFSYSVKLAQVSGDIWLAASGGYVVRYSLDVQGQAGYFGPGAAGEQQYQYELSQVNAATSFTLPEGCPAVLTEVPSMADAVNLKRMPGAVDYDSPSKITAIDAFYQAEMKKLGWSLADDHTTDSQEKILYFWRKQGLHEMQITLSAEGAQTTVNIMELGSETATLTPPEETTEVPPAEATPPVNIPAMPTLPVDLMPPAMQTLVATMMPKP